MARSLDIAVEGCGIAATTVSALLMRRGHRVTLDRAAAPSERIVSIPRTTVKLFKDLLGVSLEDIVVSRPVATHHVAWESAELESLPLAAVVCDAAALSRALVISCHIPVRSDTEFRESAPDWVLTAKGRSSADRCISAGRRRAVTGWVESLPSFEVYDTYIMTFSRGWLFAAPHPVNGIAITVVHPHDTAGGSPLQLLQDAIDECWGVRGIRVDVRGGSSVSAAPSYNPECAAPGRLTLGDSALAIDPLRGDGVGFALRGALLAQAVVAAIADGQDASLCRAHYAARLARAFKEHVESCSLHYTRAYNAPAWKGEIDRMGACLRELASDEPEGFRLDGRDLVHAQTMSL